MANTKLRKYCFCRASNIPVSYIPEAMNETIYIYGSTHETVEKLISLLREPTRDGHDLEAAHILSLERSVHAVRLGGL